MTAPTFELLKAEYATLWHDMVVSKDKIPIIDRVANRRIAAKTRYAVVERRTGVPWFVIAVIHQMECGGDWGLNLAQGDPWDEVSTHVPKGRGPFMSWEDAAVDALSIDGTNKVKDWGIERLCWELEKFNGFGSRAKGIHSPYLWSYCNHYTKGKYVADHVWDPNAVSQQVGGMPLLFRMMALDASITLGTVVRPPPAVPVVVAKPPSALAAFFAKLASIFTTKKG